MNVDSILLSEFAAIDSSNKLTVVGVSNLLTAQSLPARLPLICVSLVIHAHPDEGGTQHDGELRLLNQDRDILHQHAFRFQLKEGPPPPGVPLRHVSVQRFLGLEFEHAGAYSFEVFIDETYHAAVSFYVAESGGG